MTEQPGVLSQQGGNAPAVEVPKAALVPTTRMALVTMAALVCVAPLVSGVLGCVPNFHWEAVALVGVAAMWSWGAYRGCVSLARYLLGAGGRR
jgi:hypothetical protein